MELRGEALVTGPEQPNVIDGKLDHGKPLKPQSKSPSFMVLATISIQYLLLHNPARLPYCCQMCMLPLGEDLGDGLSARKYLSSCLYDHMDSTMAAAFISVDTPTRIQGPRAIHH